MRGAEVAGRKHFLPFKIQYSAFKEIERGHDRESLLPERALSLQGGGSHIPDFKPFALGNRT